MAELSISMGEVIIVLKNMLSENTDGKLKQIELMEKNKIKLTLSLSKFIPDIPATLAFHSFNAGVMKFDVTTNYPLKLAQPFINSINLEGFEKGVISLENNLLSLNIEEVMRQSLNWLEIKDVKMRNNNFLFSLSPSINN